MFLTGVCLSAQVVLIVAYTPAQCCNGHAGMFRDVSIVFSLFAWEFLLLASFVFVIQLFPLFVLVAGVFWPPKLFQ